MLSEKCPNRIVAHTGKSLSSVKQALFMAFSRKFPDRSNNNSSLGMKLWRPSNLILISLVTARLPLCFQAIGFHGYCRSWEKVMEIEQVRVLESQLFFPRLSNFSLINIPWIVERLQSVSRVAKVDFDNFPIVLIDFTKKRSLLYHFESIVLRVY